MHVAFSRLRCYRTFELVAGTVTGCGLPNTVLRLAQALCASDKINGLAPFCVTIITEDASPYFHHVGHT